MSPRPRIAVIVNDEPLLNALAFSLEADGWDVSGFRTPAELLARPPQLQCLLADQTLPGMDALELVAAARRRGVTAPAVILAGKPGPAFRQRAADAGIGIVDKPLV